MRRLMTLIGLSALLLAGCGGSRTSITGETSSTTGTTGTTGSGSTTTTTTPAAPTPASLTAITSVASIPSDGSAPAMITVLARNSSNDLISGVTVTFAADSGGIAVTQATTDTTGSATATLSTAGDPIPRTITVTATASGLTATVKVQVVSGSSAATTAVASLTLTSSAASILSDGSVTATISALARDASNNALSGVPVTFAASSGAIAVTQATTNASGLALATLSTGGDSTTRTITVTGTSASLSSTVQVPVVAAAATPVYAMGNGTGTGFVAGKIAAAVPSLSAGGTSGITLTIVDQNKALDTAAPVAVSFSSPCIASGLAQVTASGSTMPVTSISTSTGSLSATYVAKGCTGSDTVTASAKIGAQTLSATATFTVAASSVGSIQFNSATPTTIGLKGTGLGETSVVIFTVTDSTGAPKSGVVVSFALDSTVGGISLSPTSATSASDGTVQTVVSSGTVHTTVRVTASIASPALSTQSSGLTVTTGLPASAAFSVSVGAAKYGNTPSTLACPNVEAYGTDGVIVPVTVLLADRYNNPVPDGTSVAFTTNGGHIDGSCVTGPPYGTAGEGECTINWTSANPRPALNSDTPPLLAAGRATVLATTIGEESFTDVSGSGFRQSGDPFVNLGEPYRDDNENGQYDSGEYFLDFNQNGHWDAGTGSFVGITCTGITSGSTCTTSTLAISGSHLIIMSTSGARISLSGYSSAFTPVSANGLSIPASGTGTITINVQDTNGNSMAAGTTITSTFTATSTTPTTASTYTQSPAATFTIGCNSDLGGQDVVGSFAAGSSGSGGTVTITVTSPGTGSVTAYTIPITVP